MQTKIIQIQNHGTERLPNPLEFVKNFEYDEKIVRVRLLSDISLSEIRDLLKQITQSSIGTILYYNDTTKTDTLDFAKYGAIFYVEEVSFYLLSNILENFDFELEIHNITWIDEQYVINDML